MKQDGEDSGAGPGDGGGGVMLRKPTPSRPQLNMPPRIPFDSFGKNLDSNPSPMTLVANFLAEHDPDDSASFSSLLAGAISAEEKQTDGETNGPNGTSTKSLSPSSSFAERLAARGSGNKAPGLPGGGPIRPSTARFKSMPPSRLPIPKAPYVTIPPGLSPTTLLDSPVLLSTSHQAEPSPTTGTFPLPPLVGGNGTKSADSFREKGTEQGSSSSFVFKPFPKTGSRNCLSPLGGMAPFSLSQHISNQAHPQTQSEPALTSETKPAVSRNTSLQVSATSPAEKEQPQKVLQLPAPEQKLPVNPPVTERPTDDGFNWRKYGQKLVKGSDNPRSYYKCTYVNCPMKKKVERSPDGQVTEIVYEGEHNHPKPQPTRRMAMSAAHIMSAGSKALAGKNGSTDGHGRVDGFEASRNQVNGTANGTCEQSSSSTSDEEGNEDGPDAKRRKKEKQSKESPPIPRTVREPRVVVQTTSEVDVLDDGYRWRKYGQKVVKGNPHPRSYYKCTNLGCPVRKHVERACDDPRAVITTYEGKHNHDVPAARNSSHDRAPMDAPVATTGSVPTQSGGSDASAMSVHTSVTSPEHGSQLSRLASTLEKQAEDTSSGRESRNPEAGLVVNRVKTELQDADALPGSPARISAVTSLNSLMVRPKQEPQQDRANGMKGGY